MPVSYAGVDLPVTPDDVRAWVEKELPRIEEGAFAEQVWPGKNLIGLTFPGYTLRLPNKIDTLRWPVGASRFAVGRFIVDDARLEQLREAVYPGGNTSPGLHAATFRMEAGGDAIQAELYMLPPRPLFRAYGEPGLNLITLVDQRYFWWHKRGVVSITETVTTWESLFAQIAALLDIEVELSAIDSAYLYPASTFASHFEALPLLLDAAAYNVGHRILVDLDGNVWSLSVEDAKPKLRELLDAGRYIEAGGFASLDVSPGDLNALVPASLTVAFRKAIAGNQASDRHAVSVALTDLEIPEFEGVVGHEGAKVFRDQATAWFASANSVTPTNANALASLVRQFATDWYLWQTARSEVVLVAPVPWDTDAFCDHVEWTHRGGKECPQISTRVRRPAWNDRTEELLHATLQPAGSGSGSGGSGGSSTVCIQIVTDVNCVDGALRVEYAYLRLPAGAAVSDTPC